MVAIKKRSTCSIFSPSRNSAKRNDLERKLCQQALYKTEMCNLMAEHGACPFGEDCNYAHTESELRPKLFHPKYKSIPCKSFVQLGFCNYGSRCRFLHALPKESRVSNDVDLSSDSDINSICSSNSGSTTCRAVALRVRNDDYVILPDPVYEHEIKALPKKLFGDRLPIFKTLTAIVPT
ncbi:hypothetical protein P9112_005285 [Eukaryota sp. TZLM1-RC]